MAVWIYLFPKFIHCYFVLYLCRNFINFGCHNCINHFILYLVVIAATNARCRRIKLFYLSGISNKYKKLGRIIGNTSNLKQSVFVPKISKISLKISLFFHLNLSYFLSYHKYAIILGTAIQIADSKENILPITRYVGIPLLLLNKITQLILL